MSHAFCGGGAGSPVAPRDAKAPSFWLQPGPVALSRDGFQTGPGRSVLGRLSGVVPFSCREAPGRAVT